MPNARQHTLDVLANVLLTKDAQKLRVQDLLRKAGINRSTFYYHFKSLDDAYGQLIESGLAPIERYLALPQDAKDELTWMEHFKKIQHGFFAYCMDHNRLYHALLWGDLRERFLSAFIDRMEQLLARNFHPRLDKTLPGRDVIDDEAYYMLFYRASAYLQFSILETWAAQDFKQAPELVAEVACRMFPHESGLYSVETKWAYARKTT